MPWCDLGLTFDLVILTLNLKKILSGLYLRNFHMPVQIDIPTTIVIPPWAYWDMISAGLWTVPFWIPADYHFYPTALKGCRGIVFTHGVRMGGRLGMGKYFVRAVSQKP